MISTMISYVTLNVTNFKGLLIASTIAVICLITNQAQAFETEEQAGSFRISGLGSFLLSSANGNYENTSNTNLDGSFADLLLEYGKGLISIEGGVSFLKNSDIERHPDTNGIDHPLLINYESIGRYFRMLWMTGQEATASS